MRRFELGMTVNYASNWSVVDAVREFFQNALDEEKENLNNTALIHYDASSSKLVIKNKESKLHTSSLLLGSTTKKGDVNLIGKHGEGYKVATVVLMRNGITVKIINSKKNEEWVSKIVNSRKYENKIVVFDIRNRVPDDTYGLTVELQGITEEMYSDIVESNLHLRNDLGGVLDSDYGRLLLDEKFKGHVYVEGLYVCKSNLIDFGYDFNANMLKLDRDRGLVNSFDLKQAASTLILGIEDEDFVVDNIEKRDLEYITIPSAGKEKLKNISDKVYSNFEKENGSKSVPVCSSKEFNTYVGMGVKAVMVESQVKGIIEIEERTYIEESDIEDIDKEFLEWVSTASQLVPEYLLDGIKDLWGRCRSL